MHKFSTFLAVILFFSLNLCAQLNVYFVNVGQGDATYIELPSGGNVLIDGGPSSKSIYEFLKAKGVTKIDHVVLTHPHSDHYTGLKNVFTAFDVKNFYDSRLDNLSATGDNTLRELAATEPGCLTHYPESGSMLNWDRNVTVKVLNSCPEPAQSKNEHVINNCSMILRLYYNGNGLLFTGDAEAAIEHAITRVFKSGLESSVLKVSHHGSRYSSDAHFLERVQPKYAFISAGLNNSYGHPHKEAIDRLLAVGAKIFLTTSGTQSVTIPAPGNGMQPIIGIPLFYDPILIARPEFESIIYSPTVPLNGRGSAALEQLKEIEI
ncbi:MAG: hypothetical protein A2270_01430 [Elusimicrobia bacterium RIFOXYA12_FULL_51_18]|nr:MAG: hypothetical protein A2270_01430 [Elusimicrobia bacterium RIFOXYA12_FULL_51_18]OGS30011.1 MAG: hypothetical protein A2218_12715 [Elusimicrobia bacterium RIFOXYA2_FULL_53_38]